MAIDIALLPEMTEIPDGTPPDTCDTLFGIVRVPDLSEGQLRYLDAYRLRPSIARAARLASVHRATVYRWMAATCAFSAAMKAAAEEFFREHRAKVLADEAARQRWRDARERERRPMRCSNLARARAAKRGDDFEMDVSSSDA